MRDNLFLSTIQFSYEKGKKKKTLYILFEDKQIKVITATESLKCWNVINAKGQGMLLIQSNIVEQLWIDAICFSLLVPTLFS